MKANYEVKQARLSARHASPHLRRAFGQSMVEVLVILSLAVIVLSAGSNSPLQQVGNAIKARYASITEAVSRP